MLINLYVIQKYRSMYNMCKKKKKKKRRRKKKKKKKRKRRKKKKRKRKKKKIYYGYRYRYKCNLQHMKLERCCTQGAISKQSKEIAREKQTILYEPDADNPKQ